MYNPADQPATPGDDLQPSAPLAAALAYARQGVRVGPLYGMRPDGTCECGRADCPKPAKHPRTRHGLSEATTSELKLRQWWADWPNSGVFGRMGSKVVGLDADHGNDGIAEAAAYGVNLDGIHSVTGNGRHYLFKPPAGVVLHNTVKRLGHWRLEHCDARGEGGYLVLPPTIHASGRRYTWSAPFDVAALPPVPDRLLDMWRLSPSDPRSRETVWDEDDGVWAELADEFDDHGEVGVETARYFTTFYIRQVYAGADRNPTGFLLALQLRDAPVSYDVATPFMRHYQTTVETVRPEKDDYDWKEAEASLQQAYSQPRRARVQFGRGDASGAPDPAASATALARPAPLAPEAYYGVLGATAREIEPYVEADSAALLVNLLAASGVALGRGPYLQVGPTAHRGVLYVVTVGDTGDGKDDSAAPIRALLPNLYRGAPKGGGVDFLSLEPNILSGLSTGEGLLHQIRDQRIEKKSNPKTHAVDEVLVDAGVADKRLLVMESEFARVLSVMYRDGNTLSSVLRELWDCLHAVRSSPKTNPVVATEPHVSLLGQITPAELHRKLQDVEVFNGFVNRYLWVMTGRVKSLPEPPDYSQLALEHATRWGAALYPARNTSAYTRDPDAQAQWGAVYEGLRSGVVDGLPARAGLAREACSRAHAQVIRMALIFAALDTTTPAATITVAHQTAALAVWDYCERSAAYLFGDLSADPIANVIVDALRTRGRLTRMQVGALFSRHVASAAIQTALDTLASEGKARCVKASSGGGRPTEYWELSA